jgi:hypothetical protein
VSFVRPLQCLFALATALAAKEAPFPVRCGSGETCPEAVGMWVQPIPKGRMPDQCTGFLVERDLVLTNHHCLPKDARHAHASCAGSRFYVPRIGAVPPDSTGCREVVALSPTSERLDEPDWALVRLERPLERTPLVLDRSGVQDLDTLHAWVAEPDWVSIAARNLPAAEIRSVACVASRRTNVFRESESRADFTDPLSRKIPLASCPTWKGNSGSPALERRPDGTWAVRAVLDRSASTDALRHAIHHGGFPLLDTAVGDFAYATNTACIPWPATHPTPAACLQDSSPEALAAVRRREKEEVDSAIRSWIRPVAGLHLEGRVLQAGVWPHFAKVVGDRRPAPDAFVVPLPACGHLPADSSWNTDLLSLRFGYDRDLRWTFRMARDDSLFPIHARCKGPEGVRICQFEGTFAAGPAALRTDTLSRCPDRVASSPAR